jgi:hypothetical protein
LRDALRSRRGLYCGTAAFGEASVVSCPRAGSPCSGGAALRTARRADGEPPPSPPPSRRPQAPTAPHRPPLAPPSGADGDAAVDVEAVPRHVGPRRVQREEGHHPLPPSQQVIGRFRRKEGRHPLPPGSWARVGVCAAARRGVYRRATKLHGRARARVHPPPPRTPFQLTATSLALPSRPRGMVFFTWQHTRARARRKPVTHRSHRGYRAVADMAIAAALVDHATRLASFIPTADIESSQTSNHR